MLATMFSFFTYLLHLQSLSSLSNNHPHNNAIKRISVSTWTRPNHDLYVLHQTPETPETPEHEHKYDTKYDTKYDIEHDQDVLNKFNKNLDKRDMHKEVKNMYMLLKKLKMKQDRMERDVENHTNNHTQVHDNTKHN